MVGPTAPAGRMMVAVGPHAPLVADTVEWVVSVAAGLGCDVELVHVVPPVLGEPIGTWDAGDLRRQLRAEGQRVLDAAAARVRRRASRADPAVAVSDVLVDDSVVSALVARSRGVELVVLEQRALHGWRRWAGGSVTNAVAARAHAPVVCLPAARVGPGDEFGPVVVAAEDGHRAGATVRTGTQLARALGRGLSVLRVVVLPPAYQDILRREGREAELVELARRRLAHEAPVAPTARVAVSYEIRWGHPAEVLVDVSTTSAALVLARRDPALPMGSHLGPVVRGVVREAVCPVVVVDGSAATATEA